MATAPPVIVGDVAPPDIEGTVPDEPIASGDKIPPFATVTLTQPYFYYDYYTTPYNTSAFYDYNPKDSVIKITDGGRLTDADGLLTGPGVSETQGVAGTYTLGPDYPYNIQNELRGLSFQTVALAAGAAENPQFELDVTDTTSGLTTKDTITSVISRGLPPMPVSPYIAGTQAGQTVAPGNVIDPLASVTVSDANANPMDSATITLTNASGTPTDANGTLTGTDLNETASGSGIYTLAATSPSTLTTLLDALTFHPTGLPSGATSETTGFKLDVNDPGVGKSATDGTTTVTTKSSNNFAVFDNNTSQSTEETGEPYTGPLHGLQWQFIDLSPDNLDIAATTPDSFIYSGLGNDAINVSRAGGNNTLDATGGSNFLVGGSGNDTFYLNDLNPTAPIWSTLVGFHSGDAATIWGVTANDFAIGWAADEGASGFTGLTMHVTAPGKPAEYLTLSGMGMADLSNGHLAAQFGTATNGTPTPYLEISHL